MSKTKKHKNNPQRRARPSGWSTSDADEIERRRLRGVNEAIRIESLTPDNVFFGLYRAHSGSGQAYRVEIRSLAEPINSCDCPDHRVNGLGTCKHIEATLYRLQHRRKRAFQKAAGLGQPIHRNFSGSTGSAKSGYAGQWAAGAVPGPGIFSLAFFVPTITAWRVNPSIHCLPLKG